MMSATYANIAQHTYTDQMEKVTILLSVYVVLCLGVVVFVALSRD